MSDPKHITTSVLNTAPGEPLTIEKLLKTFEESQKTMDEMDDKLVESLMVAGFKVMVNDGVPNGMMVAVLPHPFKASVARVTKKLKAELRPEAIYPIYFNPSLS